MSTQKRLVVVGGGAAGFFCAVNAAQMNPSLEVILLEKTNKLLSKVRVSGGGRCNVTHACFDIGEMSRKYPRGQQFVRKAFHQFFTTETIEWFAQRDVELKAEADGRMFPLTDSSQTIVDCLVKEVNRYSVSIRMNAEVKKLNAVAGRKEIQVHLSKDEIIQADLICIACGGYPKSSMFEWLRELGHTIEEPVPSLFTFNMPAHPITKLMGVSVENARVRITGTKLEQEGPLLITHWGLSGPAVLKLSAWGARILKEKNWEFGISVNWLAGKAEDEIRSVFQQSRVALASQRLLGKNPFGLPQRLWEFMLEHSQIKKDTRWADLTSKDQNRLIRNLNDCEFVIKGKTTFKEEFVTAGGIRLSEVDVNTMMSRKMDHLFFAGEILDVDGITGGFNFQHAWTSGYIAAKSIASMANQE